MQMKNVLDRLTELSKENPSPDVKQAVKNTRRMSVAEGADVVEVHEGVAEGSGDAIGALPKQTSPEQPYQVPLDSDYKSVFEPGKQSGLHYALMKGILTDPWYFKLNNKVYSISVKDDGDGIPKPIEQGVAEDSLNEDPVIQFASKAHDEWRNNFDPTGTKERIKKNSDGTEGNINVPFEELHPDWKKENLAAGQAAMMAVKRFPNNIEQAAEYIHNEWMKRNPKADYNAAQHVAYDQLPEDEKEKDRVHVRTMMALSGKQGVAEGSSGKNELKQKIKELEKQARHYSFEPSQTDPKTGNGYRPNYIKTVEKIEKLQARLKSLKGVAEALGTGPDQLLARTDMNYAHKLPRDRQTNLGNIPGMNHPDASPETKAYADQQRAKRPGDLKAAIKGQLGKHIKPKLPEQSVTEGVNFAEMNREKHSTLDEMLNELHDDIKSFKECGHMSEKLRDFMEVHHYGKKQLMDAAYGPVDELADMTKLAGVPGPIGQPDEELAGSSGEMINGKEVDMDSLEVGGVDYRDSPEFGEAYFEAGNFVDGTPLSSNELEQLTYERGDLVSELASEHMTGAGDDARDRQRDMDMELDEVSDGDNGLASAHALARQISGKHGVAQHVNCDPDSGHHHCSDWYVDGETVASYNNGRRYDDSGYLDEEEMMPGEVSDVAQQAKNVEAMSGKKVDDMNPNEIKMAQQKVAALGESKQLVDECGMMGGSMQPNTPANINISASAASGGEVAAMINDLLKLAGRPENAQAHMDEPGVVAIDGTMDAGGAEELAAMLNGGQDEVVDETGEAGGFADATTQPDEQVYDENPVLTQTGAQRHTLGGYRNGDSPLAAATELEESLWRKFQNQ